MNIQSFNRVIVNTSRLTENFRILQKITGHIPVLAMVKGDGYGHGMLAAAKAFADGGCRHFGVAELCEGVALRQAGIDGEILVTTCFAGEDAAAFFEYRLTPVIGSRIQAEWLNAEAERQKSTLGIHLKINGGMGRLGFLPDEIAGFAASFADFPYLKIAGAMSHFPESDVAGAASTKENFARFITCCAPLKEKYNAIIHTANSAAILHHPETHCDMVRAGIALYGYPPAPVEGSAQQITPAMRVISRIIQLKEYPAETPISYGSIYRTYDGEKIAVIPVGYEDGLSRRFSNQGYVLAGGRRAPIRGRICMNMCMIDVSGIAGIQVGDEVVLLGRQGEEMIFADEVAEHLGTISHEVLCRFGHMNRFFE